MSCGPWQQGRGCERHQVRAGRSEAACGCKLRVLRIDNGGEFTVAEFASYCADEGVQRHYSTPYSPQ
jgi:transposase InsO family protein